MLPIIILRNKYIIRFFRQIKPYFAIRAMDCFDQVYIYSHFVCDNEFKNDKKIFFDAIPR